MTETQDITKYAAVSGAGGLLQVLTRADGGDQGNDKRHPLPGVEAVGFSTGSAIELIESVCKQRPYEVGQNEHQLPYGGNQCLFLSQKPLHRYCIEQSAATSRSQALLRPTGDETRVEA